MGRQLQTASERQLLRNRYRNRYRNWNIDTDTEAESRLLASIRGSFDGLQIENKKGSRREPFVMRPTLAQGQVKFD